VRIFLITISFINSIFYFLIYSYFDSIIDIIGPTALSGGLQNFIKIFFLLAAGFCTGIIPMLLLAPGMKRSRLDIKNLLLVGIVPFLLLVFSPGPVTGFIATKVFSNNESVRELLFYLFSRQPLWAVWLGFAAGSSVRVSFRKKAGMQAVNHDAAAKQEKIEVRDESN